MRTTPTTFDEAAQEWNSFYSGWYFDYDEDNGQGTYFPCEGCGANVLPQPPARHAQPPSRHPPPGNPLPASRDYGREALESLPLQHASP